jgi:hypothetical protein
VLIKRPHDDVGFQNGPQNDSQNGSQNGYLLICYTLCIILGILFGADLILQDGRRGFMTTFQNYSESIYFIDFEKITDGYTVLEKSCSPLSSVFITENPIMESHMTCLAKGRGQELFLFWKYFPGSNDALLFVWSPQVNQFIQIPTPDSNYKILV